MITSGISTPFGMLSPSKGQVAYALLTRSPLRSIAESPFDLHVLRTPPAFVLSQDQTLQNIFILKNLLALENTDYVIFLIRCLRIRN